LQARCLVFVDIGNHAENDLFVDSESQGKIVRITLSLNKCCQ